VINIKLEITGDKYTAAALAEIEARMRDLRPYWAQVARVFYEEERRLFETQGDGNWAQLSPRYRARKLREYPSTGILERTGDLRRSLVGGGGASSVFFAQPLALTLGTRVPYARFHQFGTSRMPARPPIITTEAEADEMAAVIRDGLMETARRLGLEVK
jgi:phage gpG-like protein